MEQVRAAGSLRSAPLIVVVSNAGRPMSDSQDATEVAWNKNRIYTVPNALARLSTRGRVVFISAVGLTAAIMTNVQYWNWYGFPGSYTVNYMFVQLVGFIVAGLVAAKIIKTGDTAMGRAA